MVENISSGVPVLEACIIRVLHCHLGVQIYPHRWVRTRQNIRQVHVQAVQRNRVHGQLRVLGLENRERQNDENHDHQDDDSRADSAAAEEAFLPRPFGGLRLPHRTRNREGLRPP
ncbi:hypothetical protein Mapa_010854 [Marchantia paleacea]|nr:hypothetical protein Mapa_010854 [Marchantia paleacea]